MSRIEVVLCNPVRTPIGTYGGSLKDMPATALGAVGHAVTAEVLIDQLPRRTRTADHMLVSTVRFPHSMTLSAGAGSLFGVTA